MYLTTSRLRSSKITSVYPDREAHVTAEMVRNTYQGLGDEYEPLLDTFDKEHATVNQNKIRDG